MMTKRLLGAASAAAALTISVAGHAHASATYIALGDSITFGETDLRYVQSLGDRGYVADFAHILADRNGGVAPNVVDLAIDGETAASFLDNTNPRTPPVEGRTNVPLQLENLNYKDSTALSQSQLFASTVAAQKTAGNTISTISLTLGFNELGALAPSTNTPAAEAAAIAKIPATLAAFKSNDSAVLTEIRSLAPHATLYLNGYYDPFSADPSSPAASIFAAGGAALNSVIQSLAAQYDGIYVDNSTPFLGHEALYTYLADQPAGSSVPGPYGGVLPIGNVHPNALGYQTIADDMAAAAVPETPAWTLLAIGFAGLGAIRIGAKRRSIESVRLRVVV